MKTKNKILPIFILFIVLALTVNAQRRDVLGDFKVGVNLSEMDIKGANMYKESKIGFSITGNVAFRLFSNMYLQTGFGLTKKGLKQHDTSIEVKDQSLGEYIEHDLKQTIDVNYMQVPLSLGVEVPVGKSLYVNAYAGAYGGYAFRGHVTPYAGTETYWIAGNKTINWITSQEEDVFETRRIKRFDYGAIGSVGLVWSIYTLTFAYEHGLCDIADIKALSDDNSGAKKVLKNRNMSVALGFRF